MERIVEFDPAYDERNNPKGNYGIHGVNLRMILKGDKGAVQFVLYTNWHLPHVQDELTKKVVGGDELDIKMIFKPTPADLGYHSYKPMYEDQYRTENCQYLDGHECYYDGSSLNAYRIYDILLKEGSKGVWRELEEYYNDVYCERIYI